MSTLQALRESSLAKYGTYGLFVLWYAIYTMGTLLEFGLQGVTARTPVLRIGVASVAFLVGLALIHWLFESKAD